MANYSIKVDLQKLQGAFIQNLTGRTETKRCLIIPVDDCDGIFVGEKGCYLNLTAFELDNPHYSDTHCVKVDIPKEKREAMTEQQKYAVPILGGMKPFGASQQAQPKTNVEEHPFEEFGKEDGNLPF